MQFSAAMLPDDVERATLAGRLALPEGPTPVLIRDGAVEDMSRVAPTMADLIELRRRRSRWRANGCSPSTNCCARAEELLLAPIDLQSSRPPA